MVGLGLSNIGAGQWPVKFVFRQKKGRDGGCSLVQDQLDACVVK